MRRGQQIGGNGELPSPAQLLMMAKALRKEPARVRSQNPQLAGFTDEQMRALADQYEQAARNPAQFKEMEKITKMSEGERNALQEIQDGFTGARKMDAEWINNAVAAVKKDPEFFKSLVKSRTAGAAAGGWTPEQIESFFDTIVGLDAWILRSIIHVILFVNSMIGPARELYTKVDNATFGMARVIVILTALFIAYYVGLFSLRMTRFVFRGVWLLISSLLKMAGWNVASAATSSANSATAASATMAAMQSAAKETATTAAATAAGATAAAAAAGAAGKAAAAGAAGAGAGAGAAGAGTKSNKKKDVDAEFDFNAHDFL